MAQGAMLLHINPYAALRGVFAVFGQFNKVRQDTSGNRNNASDSGSRYAYFSDAPWASIWYLSLRAAGGNCQPAMVQAAMEVGAREKMGLKFSRWSIQPATRGINFVGYRIWASYKLLRRDSVLRAKRKIRHFTKHNDTESLRMFVASWKGHAQWADSNNLLKNLGVA